MVALRATVQTSEVFRDLRGLKSLLNRPRKDQFVGLTHEADGLPEGPHDPAVVGHVVAGEGTSHVVRLDEPVRIRGSVVESVPGLL